MTTSRLPAITVTCPNDHHFDTKARGGQSIDCPHCRTDGHRVKVWVPTHRPTTARALAAAIGAPGPGGLTSQLSTELAARWQQERPWDGGLRLAPGRAGDVCPECSGPLEWEPGRTLVYCPECKRAGLPDAVTEHYARQLRRSTAVAVRAEPDRSAERAARVQLRAAKDAVKRRVQTWLESVADEDSYDRVQFQRQAFELAAMLRAYLPEISEAEDEVTLGSVLRDVDALITGDQASALKIEYEQAQERAERQHRAREQTAELERYRQEAADQQERERQAAEREARQLAQQERKAITSGRTTTTTRLPPVSPYAPLVLMIAERQKAKEQRIASNGKCAFKHLGDVPATRIYAVPMRVYGGQMSGYRVAEAPEYRACGKHHEAAEAQLNRDGYSDVAYWEL